MSGRSWIKIALGACVPLTVFAAATTIRASVGDSIVARPVADRTIEPVAALERAAPSAEVARAPQGEAPRSGRVRDVLEAYWGRPWSELAPTLDRSGWSEDDFDRDALVAPWSDVEAVVRRNLTRVDDAFRAQQVTRALGWGRMGVDPNFADPFFNPKAKEIDEHARAELAARAKSYDERLESAALRATELIGAAFADQWDRGGFARAPLIRTLESAEPAKAKHGRFTTSTTNVTGGWICDLDFDSGEHPEVEREFDEIEHLKAERLAAVRAAIDELP